MSPGKTAASRAAKTSRGLTDEEKAAMMEHARELKASRGKVGGEEAVLAKTAEMTEPDRSMARRLHAIIITSAPALLPKTWYGMPAYANQDGKVVCFFQSAAKFNARYAKFGFNDAANLGGGDMLPTSFAPRALTAAEEAKIAALVKRAAI